MQKSKILITIGALILVIGGVFYFTSKPLPKKEIPSAQAPTEQSGLPKVTQNQPATVTSTPALKPTSPTPSKPTVKVVAPRPLITAVALSASISTSTTSIRALNPTTVFTPRTNDIFAVLTLKNATQRTQLSYIRYYEGKYVESNVSHPTKVGTKNFYFQWALKAGRTRKAGNYTLAFYVDGKKSQVVNYSVR